MLAMFLGGMALVFLTPLGLLFRGLEAIGRRLRRSNED